MKNTRKMDDPDSGRPKKVKNDPYKELFADCHTVADVMQLQAEIDAMEKAEAQKRS